MITKTPNSPVYLGIYIVACKSAPYRHAGIDGQRRECPSVATTSLALPRRSFPCLVEHCRYTNPSSGAHIHQEGLTT